MSFLHLDQGVQAQATSLPIEKEAGNGQKKQEKVRNEGWNPCPHNSLCAWLTPVGHVIAASGSSDFTVTVTVMDTLAVDMDDVLGMNGGEGVEVSVVTRTGADSVAGAEGEGHSELVVTFSRL